MESHVVNLQDKIQKLIDQYTLDKKKLEDLEAKNRQLTEENSQLFAQIEASSRSTSDMDAKYKALQDEYNKLESLYSELQKTISGFESIAAGAIEQIDNIFPLIDGD